MYVAVAGEEVPGPVVVPEGGHTTPTHLLMITMSLIACSEYMLRALFSIGIFVLGSGLLAMCFRARTSGLVDFVSSHAGLELELRYFILSQVADFLHAESSGCARPTTKQIGMGGEKFKKTRVEKKPVVQ